MTVLVGEATHLRGIAIDDDTSPSNGQGLYYDLGDTEWKFGTPSHTHAESTQGGTITHEAISDFDEGVFDHVAAGYSGGTQTGLTITSQDDDNTFDFSVTYGTGPGAVSSSTSGSAGVANSASRSDHNHDLGAHTHTDATTGGTVSHTFLTDIGTNAHSAIDTFISTTVPAYFNTSSGHDHDGADSAKVVWANVDKTTSSIADITTKSHTALSDIGTATHANIDTFISTTVPAYFNTSSGHDHDGTDSKKVTYTDLVNIPASFTPASHTLEGHTATVTAGQVLTGTGVNTFGWASPAPTWAQVDKTTSSIADITTKSHTALSDIGTNTHAQIDTFIGTTVPAYFNTSSGHDHDGSDSKKVIYTNLASIPSTFAPSAHGTSAHSGTIGDASQIAVGTFPASTSWAFAGASTLSITNTSAKQLRLAYDGSYYTDFTTDSSGYLTIAPSGSRVGINCTPATKLHLVETDGAFIGLGHTSWPTKYYAAIGGRVTEGSGDCAGRLRFWTRQASTYTLTERMVIGEDGYVGINCGTDGTGARFLEVRDNTANPQLRLSHTAGSVYTDFTTDLSGYLLIDTTGNMVAPSADNAETLGGASNRWSSIYGVYTGATGTRYTNGYYTNLTSTNALTVDSDERWKEDISDTYGLSLVQSIPARSFKWRKDSGRADGVRHSGFVAQEFRDKLQDLGITDTAIVRYDEENDEYGLATGELIPILWTAVQELSAKVAALEAA